MRLNSSYNGIPAGELKQFLDEKYLQYNTPSFIECDPISIPYRYNSNTDKEVAGFLTAAIAWGRRDLILRSSSLLMEVMDNNPYEFIMDASNDDLEKLSGFVHRTFNGKDCIFFMKGLKEIYSRFNSMEDVILEGMRNTGSIRDGLSFFRKQFFALPHEKRTEKHFADVLSGAAGKRLNMFLRIIKVAD
jgi:uncharacterized protein (TIGR02757 family)